jgi:hypothetical protein
VRDQNFHCAFNEIWNIYTRVAKAGIKVDLNAIART